MAIGNKINCQTNVKTHIDSFDNCNCNCKNSYIRCQDIRTITSDSCNS